jgi:hypothetical protein
MTYYTYHTDLFTDHDNDDGTVDVKELHIRKLWEIEAVAPLPTQWTSIFYCYGEGGHFPVERCPAILLMKKVAEQVKDGEIDDEIDNETMALYAVDCGHGALVPIRRGESADHVIYLATVAGNAPNRAALQQLLAETINDGTVEPPDDDNTVVPINGQTH